MSGYDPIQQEAIDMAIYKRERSAEFALRKQIGSIQMTMTRGLIRADGTAEPLEQPLTDAELVQRLNSGGRPAICRLRHLGKPSMVMLFDAGACCAGRPFNVRATAMYAANCAKTTDYRVCGDVVVAPEADIQEES